MDCNIVVVTVVVVVVAVALLQYLLIRIVGVST